MGKRKVKEFAPKPLTPGAAISWTQYHLNGMTTERTGVVIDRAPAVNGAQIVCWVMPDKRLETDLHSIVAVGKANTYGTAHGRYLESAAGMTGVQYVRKAEMFASDDRESATGALAALSVREPGTRLHVITGKAGDYRSGTREVTCVLYATDQDHAREVGSAALGALSGYSNATVLAVRAL